MQTQTTRKHTHTHAHKHTHVDYLHGLIRFVSHTHPCTQLTSGSHAGFACPFACCQAGAYCLVYAASFITFFGAKLPRQV
eukprot:m.255811 g.255811  ORF g.255811 m.255811 type:complete len:80 (-) comp20258_c0_seq1:1005-1244(-)